MEDIFVISIWALYQTGSNEETETTLGFKTDEGRNENQQE